MFWTLPLVTFVQVILSRRHHRMTLFRELDQAAAILVGYVNTAGSSYETGSLTLDYGATLARNLRSLR